MSPVRTTPRPRRELDTPLVMVLAAAALVIAAIVLVAGCGSNSTDSPSSASSGASAGASKGLRIAYQLIPNGDLIVKDRGWLEKALPDTTITWVNPPGPFGVYRGTNGPGGTPWTYNQTCFAPGVVVAAVADTAVPAPGVFFYYLVTRFNECRESAPGEDGTLNPIPNALPCPAP